jgi:hypothetical protein
MEINPQRTSPDKKMNTAPDVPRKNWSPQKPQMSQSPSKPYLYSNDRPRPLPMTETQESNFTTHGRRRVTIEHDINRLQCELSIFPEEKTKVDDDLSFQP